MKDMRVSLVLLAPLLDAAFAGSVALYSCAVGENAAGTMMAIRVHYSYDENECPKSKKRSWDAFSGPIPSIWAFKEFCGGKDGDGNKYSKDFCGNMDFFGDAGLHIKLHGHDLAIGDADDSVDLDVDSDYARNLCSDLRLSGPYTSVSAGSWRDVKKTTCV